jgi:hypothetical protein
MFVQWSTFTKRDQVADCLSLGVAGLRRYGFDVWFEPAQDEFIVVGGNDDVTIQITGAANSDGETRLSVVASTQVSDRLAEYARNAVREHIVNPASPPIPPI